MPRKFAAIHDLERRGHPKFSAAIIGRPLSNAQNQNAGIVDQPVRRAQKAKPGPEGPGFLNVQNLSSKLLRFDPIRSLS
jgi:hypothetical protein